AAAYAQAYLSDRADSTRSALADQISAVQARLDDLHSQQGAIAALIAQTPSNSPDLITLRTTQTTLSTQAGDLTTPRNELQTTPIAAGRMVAEPQAPGGPASPSRPLYLGVATALGTAGGALAGVAHGRWSRRVHQGGDLGRHQGIRLLAELDAAALGTG